MPNKEQLRLLMSTNKVADIATIFGVHKRTVGRWISEHNLSYEEVRLSNYPSSLTAAQNEFIIGSLLGDGSVRKDGSYKLSQSKKRKKYIDYVFQIMSPFAKYYAKEVWTIPRKKKGQIIGRSDRHTEGYSVSTIVHPVFRELRSIWYKEGVKIVPEGVKLTPFSLSVWYMDDGSNRNSGASKDIRLNTQSFSMENVRKLSRMLERDLGIKSSIQKDKGEQAIIRVGAGNYFKFIDIVRNHVQKIDCFSYKINTSQVPKDRRFIDKQTKESVVKLYEKYSQMKIASMLGISQSSVSNIIQTSVGGCQV
jgi:transposase